MEICYSAEGLAAYLEAATSRPTRSTRCSSTASSRTRSRSTSTRSPTATEVRIAGIMQHVEEAGVHSGDSACVLPPMSLGEEMLDEIRADHRADRARARGDRADQHPVRGRGRQALRDRGQPARLAHRALRLEGDRRPAREGRLPADARRAAGRPGAARARRAGHVSVKEAVLPFARFAGRRLGPRPGDEVDRRGDGHRGATSRPPSARRSRRRGSRCRARGPCSSRVTDTDKPAATQLAARFHDLGFRVIATRGTAQAISRMGVPVTAINKIAEGSPHVVDYIRNGEVDLVINTPTGSGARSDGYEIRTAAVRQGIPCMTTMTGASAAARAIFAQRASGRRAALASRSSTSARRRRPRRARSSATRSRERRHRWRADERAPAPLGRRLCEVVENRAGGRLPDLLGARRGRARAARRASSTCSRRRAAGASGTGGPICRARSRSPRREAAEDGVRLDFLVEAVGPGHRAARRRCERARGCGSPGRSGGPSRRPRELGAGDRRRDPGRRRDRARAAGDPAPPARRRAACRLRTLLGFRDREHSGGRG